MLTLNDGRSELWQWDTGRKLTVDADCSQVHFSNKIFGRSIDVDVVDGVAIIPDVLLQTDKDLFAWAFVGTAENGYTKISKTFKVNRRNKPADYVFTPPDQTSLEEIKERLENLESIQDPDAIKNAVEEYLEENPVEAPVKSVNGQTGKIELSAKDVGAISQDDLQEATNEALAQAKASGEFKGEQGEPGPAGHAGADGQPGEPGADGKTPIKGTDYFTEADKQEIAEAAAGLVKVPEATMKPLTFTGAVNATYDGSEPVSVEIPTGGGGAGGGENPMKLIYSNTVVQAGGITDTVNGLKDCKELYFEIIVINTDATSRQLFLYIGDLLVIGYKSLSFNNAAYCAFSSCGELKRIGENYDTVRGWYATGTLTTPPTGTNNLTAAMSSVEKHFSNTVGLTNNIKINLSQNNVNVDKIVLRIWGC